MHACVRVRVHVCGCADVALNLLASALRHDIPGGVDKGVLVKGVLDMLGERELEAQPKVLHRLVGGKVHDRIRAVRVHHTHAHLVG